MWWGEASAVMRNFRKFCHMTCGGAPSSRPEGTFSVLIWLSTAFWDRSLFPLAVLRWVLGWERSGSLEFSS